MSGATYADKFKYNPIVPGQYVIVNVAPPEEYKIRVYTQNKKGKISIKDEVHKYDRSISDWLNNCKIEVEKD